MWKRVLATAIATFVVMSLLATAAGADGDPASDVLLGESVFYPYQPVVSESIKTRLNAELAAAGNGGLAVKVALIASRDDLGAIPDLFGKPQQYARFLDQEISFQKKQPLLVVMAAGYGIDGLGAKAKQAIAALPKPRSGVSDDLARAAIAAVPRIVTASGYSLKIQAQGSSSNSSGGSSRTTIVLILALAALAVAAALAILRLRQAAARRTR